MIRPVISGVFGTKVGKLVNSSCLSLHVEAALGACADADIALSEIDGVLCAYSMTEPHLMLSSWFCEYLGIKPKATFAVQAGGATACVMAAQASALVRSGMCRNVLIVTGDNRLTGLSRDGAVAALSKVGHPQFERPYGISVPASYALVAQRYMHEYHLTLEEMAAVAVSARNHAARHPNSQLSKPITIEDVCASKAVSSPLRLLDCSLISDGGAAAIISAAPATGSGKPVVGILGTGQGHTHEHILAAPSLTHFGCKEAAAAAFAEAGVTPSDIDVAEIYDSFTITLIVELESMGFFEKGEAGKAALAGELDLGGSLPCNTHGGLLSHGHPGAAGGMYHLIEAVHQLRGVAAERQVKDAELAFVHGDGGILSAHCSLILGCQ